MAKKKVARKIKRAKSPGQVPVKRVRAKPQVWIEVGPRGFARWSLTIDHRLVMTDFNKKFLMDVGRDVKNSIAESGGRAELVVKGRDGKIQERDSGGDDPKESRG